MTPSLFKRDKTQRIMAIWFPQLPAERVMRQRYGRSWRQRLPAKSRPLIFSQRENNTQRIRTLDTRAKALKLKPGMGIAEACALHPAIEIIEADPEADRRLLDGLADWCDRYTPLVAIDGADGLFLDITGCAHLFGGEDLMLDKMKGHFFQLGFDARVGLASTPGAAWAAARFASMSTVAPGEEGALIAPLPLHALRLEPQSCNSLQSVGLRTIGSLMATPRGPLVRRFGKQVMLRLDQALGKVAEAISPRLPVPPLSVERHLAEPISLMEDIEALVGLLAVQLKAELERRCEGAERLVLLLFRVDGDVSRIAVGASRPLREPDLIRRLFHERLAALETEIDAGYGFDLVRLCVEAAAPLDAVQADLAGQDIDISGIVSHFADRVHARLGSQAVTLPIMVESHIPERAVVSVPFSQASAVRLHAQGEVGISAFPGRERPIRLFDRPECVDVIAAEVPEGPPSNFRWRRALYRVARAEGPERIAPEWWSMAPDPKLQDDETLPPSAGLTRDYFRVEDADGRRYWLYRQGLYGAAQPPRWFIHGIFA